MGRIEGEAILNFDASHAGCSSLLTERAATGIAVPVVSINGLFRVGQMTRPDFIKIDVEGFEWEVLRGLVQTIDSKTVILCEYNPSFLTSIGRDAQASLDFVNWLFEEVTFISELSGRRKAVKRVEDLNGQIVANLVLSGLRREQCLDPSDSVSEAGSGVRDADGAHRRSD